MKREIQPKNKTPSGDSRFFSNIILLLFSAIITLFLAETALRLIGKKPGYVPRYSRFKIVQRLEVDSSFYTDAEGVFKANPNYPKWTDDIYINSEGFRSREFDDPQPMRKLKILFLGDSFTWGSSARPITNCFVDLLEQAGFAAYNTGIPGTAPQQYAYLAEKYAPLLKPDIIAVMFYLGNDFIPPRPIRPFKNLYHVTNAKFLYAFDEKGNYMTPQQAYEYYLAKNNAARAAEQAYDNTFTARLRTMFMKTVVGTYVWVSGAKIKRGLLADSDNNNSSKNYEHVRQYLLRIKQAAENVNAHFMLFVIPVHPRKENFYNSVAHHREFLQEFDAYIPDFLLESDYMELPNSHFNNSGRRKYADFIAASLGSLGAHDIKPTNGS